MGTPSYEGCWNMGVIEVERPQAPALQTGVTLVTRPVAQEQSHPQPVPLSSWIQVLNLLIHC